MHVTTKEVDNNGTHILTSVLEADGAGALASELAKLEAKVVSVQRTASGGIQVQVAVNVAEPAPEVVKSDPVKPSLSAEEQAVAYFQSKGFSAKEAQEKTDKFGVQRVLAMRDKELDEELAEQLEAPAKK